MARKWFFYHILVQFNHNN